MHVNNLAKNNINEPIQKIKALKKEDSLTKQELCQTLWQPNFLYLEKNLKINSGNPSLYP